MLSIRPGWRWCNGGLWFCEEWEKVDQFKSPTERIKGVVSKTLGGLVDCLAFTCEDFPDGWLLTLDISMRVTATNQIEYCFF